MHKTNLCFATVLLLLAGALPARAQFGDIFNGINKGRQIHEATQEWTPEQEEAAGRASAAKMIHVFALYNNPSMTNYVNLVGNTVAQFGTRNPQYHFAILDTDMINAFAMPGGHVFITLGTLANANNEYELAATPSPPESPPQQEYLDTVMRAR